METRQAEQGLKFIKKCTKCGRELPLSMYHLRKSSKDGHSGMCKDCTRIYDKERAAKKIAATKKRRAEKKAQSIPLKASISNLSDSELFDELKRRGYAGELHFTRVVNI